MPEQVVENVRIPNQYTSDDFEDVTYAHWPKEIRSALKVLRPGIRSLLESDLGLPFPRENVA